MQALSSSLRSIVSRCTSRRAWGFGARKVHTVGQLRVVKIDRFAFTGYSFHGSDPEGLDTKCRLADRRMQCRNDTPHQFESLRVLPAARNFALAAL